MNRITLLLGSEKLAIAHILYREEVHDGVFSFGSNYKSSYGEVLYAAFESNAYFLRNEEILEKIEKFQTENIFTIIGNMKTKYYGCESGIAKLKSKFPCMTKILLYFYVSSCIIMKSDVIDKFGLQLTDIVNIIKAISVIVRDINCLPLVVKFIPFEQKFIPQIDNYREIVVWSCYELNRKLENITEKGNNRGKLLYTYGYIKGTKKLYNQAHIANRDKGCAAYIVLLYMGISIKNHVGDFNIDIKAFRNFVFMLATRLLTLNQSGFLHGDMHIDNFVYHRGSKNLLERSDIYFACDKLRTRSYINCNGIYDIVDFGESVMMTESGAIADYIFKCAPDLHKRYNSQISELCKISPEDIAIAVSLLDLHYYISDWEIGIPNTNLYSELIADMKNYILEEIIRYLDYDGSLAKSSMCGGATLNNSVDEQQQQDIHHYILNHKSVFSQEYIGSGYEIFGGIDKILSKGINEPLYNFKNSTKSYKLDHKSLPIWRFMQTFYAEESATISNDDLKDAVIFY